MEAGVKAPKFKITRGGKRKCTRGEAFAVPPPPQKKPSKVILYIACLYERFYLLVLKYLDTQVRD